MLQKLPRPSDPEPREPAFAWERFSEVAKEIVPLLKRHWMEVEAYTDKVPLDFNWARYLELDALNLLRTLTVRSNGVLIGYHTIIVYPHLRYCSTLWAESDMFYLEPAYREGWTGYTLLKLARDKLKEEGVKVHKVGVKLRNSGGRGPLTPILRRLGYDPVETVLTQYLGDA